MREISIQAFKKQVQHPSPDVMCVDVRSRDEHEDVHIPGVVNIPLEELREHIEEFRKRSAVYLHCASGNRSRLAAQMLADAGLTNVYSVAGGLVEWRAAGLPTVCRNQQRAALPLWRQVMIAVGVLLLLGVLAALIDPRITVVVTGIITIGLLFGSITGRCLMMALLMRAPWNRSCH